MSGYKRVNFYELCRLCASNQQKEKTHIFHEDGRKKQLQAKIHSVLSLKVSENDFLPKVVCNKCMLQLEENLIFRNQSESSETMLSSYFHNYRNTQDFNKSGMVYIKDTTPAPTQEDEHPQMIDKNIQVTYKPQKLNELNNIILNSNGELLNITNVSYDIDNYLNQNNSLIKQPINNNNKAPVMKKNEVKLETIILEDLELNFDKSPHIKRTPPQINKSINFHQHIIPSQNFTKMNVLANTNLSNSNILMNTANTVITNSQSNYVATTFNQNKLLESLNNSAQKLEQTGFITNVNTFVENKLSQPEWIEVITEPECPQKPTDEPKLFMCDMCKRSFKRREHLYQHMKLHTGFRPFLCEHCNKSFMRKEHLIRHQTSHSGLKNFVCNICGKSFSRNDNLLKHKKTHDKETGFTCEICQKQFVMRHYYVAHRLTHDSADKCSDWVKTEGSLTP